MKKTKNNGIRRIVIAVVLAVALFSMAFIGVNSLVFAAATSKTESLPPATAAVGNSAGAGKAEGLPPAAAETNPSAVADIPAEDSAPAEAISTEPYQAPNLDVYVPENEWYTPGVNAISPEEAAEIGALYIWEMLGESIDGKVMSMHYSAWPSHSRPYWHGTVADSREDLDLLNPANQGKTHNPLFDFSVCAVSGERIGLTNYKNRPEMSREARVAFYELQGLNYTRGDGVVVTGSGSPEKYNELLEQATANLSQTEIEGCTQAAREFAQKHFVGTEVVKVVSAQYCQVGIGAYELDGDGNLNVTQLTLFFAITDETGREAEVAIAQGTKDLLYISTQMSDIVPGFNAEMPGSLG